MKTFKKVLSIIMIAAVIASICVVSTVSSGAAATGAGLAEWALNAYYSHWSYVWGGSSPGAVDCSGLIWSYCGGNRTSMLSDAQANGRDWGYVSSGIPRVHGLGLSRPGHVGVYIADGMEVDARGSQYGVCYDAIGGWNNWDCWFKLTAVTYPTTGWEQFNGNSYYYENGEYIVNTSRTIDGVTYYFDATGACSSKATATTVDESDSSDADTNSSSTVKEDNGPLKNGSKGEKVEKLQARLAELGYYNGAIDGDFGKMTEKAFKLFQKNAGLYVDGIAGSDADVLYADGAPNYVASTEAPAEETVAEEDNEEEILNQKDDSELADTGAEDNNTEDVEDADEAEESEDTEEDAEVTYSLGDYADEVALIQTRLSDLGYLEGQADGEFGEQTETAVKDFQGNNELVETGIVDEVTYDALFSETAIKNPEVKAAAEEKKTDKKDMTKVNTPKTANNSAVAPTATPNTEVEKKTIAVTSKSLSGVTNSVDMQKNAKTTNFEFILWLGIMIVVMLITFTIVFTIEKKKQRAAARSRRFY